MSSNSGYYRLQTRQGLTKVVRFTFPLGTALTSYTAVAQGRRKPGASNALFSLTSSPAAGLTIGVDGASKHYVEMTLTDEQTEAIAPLNDAVWEMHLTSGGGTVPFGFHGEWDHEAGAIV